MAAHKQATLHRWENLPKDAPTSLAERRRIIGEQAMISQILLRKGCYVPTHSHTNEQFCLVIHGKMRFGLGAEGAADRRTIDLVAGDALQLPANVPHSAEAIEESLVFDVFSPPSATTGIDHA